MQRAAEIPVRSEHDPTPDRLGGNVDGRSESRDIPAIISY